MSTRKENLECIRGCYQWGYFHYAQEIPYNTAVLRECERLINDIEEQPKISIINDSNINLIYKDFTVEITGDKNLSFSAKVISNTPIK